MFRSLKNNRSRRLNYIFGVLLSLAVIYSVFFLKTDLTQYRTIQELWNLGHIFLFTGLSYLVIKHLFKDSPFSVYTQFILIMIGSVLLGMLIEYLQTFTGRDKSGYDVLLDLVGGCIGFILFSKTLSRMSRLVRASFGLGVVVFTLVVLMPMLNIIIDDLQQRKEFPVLVSNKSDRELSRFITNKVGLKLVPDNNKRFDYKLLRMDFYLGKYPTAGLGDFNEDWSRYKYLSFNVFSPYPTSSFNIRIHDEWHEHSGYRYQDRFNDRIQLSSGWNKIRIALYDVKRAPLKRDMNMQQIRKLMFFKINLNKPVYFLFSPIKLEK